MLKWKAYSNINYQFEIKINIFLMYLFIRLNVSIYILIIYKWSKMRAWHAFWLNIKEMQLWKHVSGFCLTFLILLVL